MARVTWTANEGDESAVLGAPASTIVADDRERPSGIPELLREQADLEVTIERLKVGDYLVDDLVIVERKTLADFALSLIDTRLFKQASLLNRSRWRPAFLIEGTELPEALPQHAFNGALIALTLAFDIPVLRSTDTAESARILTYCARQLGNTILRGLPSARWKPKRIGSRRLHVLASLPGVGRETARRLLDHFGTVEACFTADEMALHAVPGIGERRARELRRLVAGEDDD